MAKAMIGFVGIGIMGYHMARRLAENGYPIRVWNRTPDKAGRLAAFGAGVERVAVDVADAADFVICMLSSGPVCDDILLGPNGVMAAMRPGATLIVMSSIPVDTATRHAREADARGIRYIDAPVSGGEKGAEAGTLAIMAGGDPDVVERARPVLEIMGRPVRIGPNGTGQLSKLVNQMMVASTIAAVAEALLLAERGGADPAKVREALLGGFADSTILRQHGLRMIEGNFVPGGPAKYQIKDTATAIDLAKGMNLDLPILNLVDRLFADMVAHGDGDLDHSAILLELRRRQPVSAAPAMSKE
ncbi:3-hydroxyisobutyrate dehydrogenase [Propionivibrio dicarboxylicus]|uniref:3-hydroxyisobutyrate dehydrogenase n=2 Tax=Propionivibrio dicarboxylicus TaxID=83767 RepID=A0A1G8KF88_9RHOO|nr:NAD(P)-dependent oxidoreductase [Propionivibrio dicarboxylicus]SDI41540.1 3-hydroxyisobutyrate dehydrogenase [Propionivibrio dicarboxylicus]